VVLEYHWGLNGVSIVLWGILWTTCGMWCSTQRFGTNNLITTLGTPGVTHIHHWYTLEHVWDTTEIPLANFTRSTFSPLHAREHVLQSMCHGACATEHVPVSIAMEHVYYRACATEHVYYRACATEHVLETMCS
jgi:hypothetical protein